MAVHSDDLLPMFLSKIPDGIRNEDVIFVCVGTDRSTGDSLGPLVGSYLQELGYPNVFGNIDEPVHAVNLSEVVNQLDPNKKVIAIDACLGKPTSVGLFSADRGPLYPGAGLDKDLPPIGDYHITGVVNIGGFMEYFVLQNTRLSLVVRMAKEIVRVITQAFPMQQAMLEVAAGLDVDPDHPDQQRMLNAEIENSIEEGVSV